MIKFQNSRRIIFYSVFLFCFFSFGFLFFGEVNAAQLNIDPQSQEFALEQEFKVDLIINAQGEQINALEGKVFFPSDLLEVREIQDGKSIINFWIEKPREEDGVVIFSGITPGGFEGEKNLVFSIIFQTKKAGEGDIQIKEARVLKNDGLGTPADISIQTSHFTASENISAPEAPAETKIRDYAPPETFKPEIARDALILDGKWFLVFATQDKSSGVDHYEVKERKRAGILNWKLDFWKKWQRAESPYVLSDQELKSYVYVKAVDKENNERIISLSPQNSLVWYENYLFYAIIIIVISIITVCLLWANQRRKKILRE